MELDRDLIYFNVLRNALYHTARRRWHESVSRFFNFIMIVLGATAISGFLLPFGFTSAMGGALIAAIGAYQLAYDPAGRGREHQILQRDYYRLLADIEAVPEVADDQMARWRGEMIRITGDESPTLRVIDAKAYNDAIDATGVYGQDQRLKIGFFAGLFGGFFTFDGLNFKKVGANQQDLLTKADS